MDVGAGIVGCFGIRGGKEDDGVLWVVFGCRGVVIKC